MQEPVFKPIGIVRNDIKEPRRDGWEKVTSEIVVDESLAEGLDGLEEYSHILVVFWMHKVPVEPRPVAKIHPQGRADLPLVGLFATRSPYRPNPVGVSAPRLVERRGNVLSVVGLDAIDGTPVLDIKPYLPHLDAPVDYRGPDWVSKLRR
ncbi:MAG: tRNA (N6-threonylcarbamoyladenosine(37)-N6)-methyltransferase TrmO [Dehalococcoidia bacterium]